MRRRGFTLVEVLVALTVMTVMAGLAWRGIDAMVRSRDANQAALEATTRLQTVLAQFQQDVEQIQASVQADGRNAVPSLQFDGRHLRFTRRHPQGLQVVVWYVVDGALWRWAAAPATDLDSLRQASEHGAQPLTMAATALKVLPGVLDWQLASFACDAWTNAQSTGALEDLSCGTKSTGPERSQLPGGLRFTLQFAPEQGYGGPLTRQFMLRASP